MQEETNETSTGTDLQQSEQLSLEGLELDMVEIHLIAAIIADNRKMSEVSDLLHSEAFFRTDWQDLYNFVQDTINRNEPVSFDTEPMLQIVRENLNLNDEYCQRFKSWIFDMSKKQFSVREFATHLLVAVPQRRAEIEADRGKPLPEPDIVFFDLADILLPPALYSI